MRPVWGQRPRRSPPDSAPALSRYAAGRVLQMEGVDRPSSSDVERGRRAAARAHGAVLRAAPDRGTGGARPAPRLPISPADGEAFFGPVVARAPAGADAATLRVDGRAAGVAPIRAGRARFALDGSPGRHELRVTFTSAGRPVHVTRTRRA